MADATAPFDQRDASSPACASTHRIGYREGLESLKVTRQIAVWFHRSCGRHPDFKPGPFQLPDDPSQKLLALQQHIAQHAASRRQTAHTSQAEMALLLEAQATQEREMSLRAQEEAAIYQELAEEAGARAATLQAQFDALWPQRASRPAPSRCRALPSVPPRQPSRCCSTQPRMVTSGWRLFQLASGPACQPPAPSRAQRCCAS